MSLLRHATTAVLWLGTTWSGACSRVPEEPNPVVKEMRPTPGNTLPEPGKEPGKSPSAGAAGATTVIPAAAANCPDDPTPSVIGTLFGHGEASFVTPDGTTHTFKMEIAKHPKAHSRGLMYRTSLADDAGMVFDFPQAHQASFWMHNTCIPLDMVFVSEDNLVIGVVTAPPLNDSPRGVNGLSKYVVELAAGQAKKRGIGIGTRFVPPPGSP